MSNVHSSRVVEGEGDNAFRLELPQGIISTLVGKWNEEVEEDESDEDIDDGAEIQPEPITGEDGVFTIKKKNDWKDLRDRIDKSGIRKLVFDANVFYINLIIEGFPDLTEICIHDLKLQLTENFVVADCNALTAITIGSHCMNGKEKKRKWRKEFRIDRCPNLKSVVVGEDSCRSFNQCSVDSTSMTVFEYGKHSFAHCPIKKCYTSRASVYSPHM